MTYPKPGQDLAGYLRAYTHQMTFSNDDPDVILDRYHTADFVHHNDGIALDREKLIAHAKPVRRNVVSCRLDLHDTLVDGDRVAARYTIHSVMRKGRPLAIEVAMFGELAGDGRLRRVVTTTRTVRDETT